MPFSWFSGHQTKSEPTAVLTSSLSASSKSLSLSGSSKDRSARLAEVRAKTKKSFLRKEMAQSGELSLSRSKGNSGHGRNKSTATSNALAAQKQNPKIVAMEPDTDISTHRRIDQGLLDASREAQMAQQKQVLNSAGSPTTTSWWSSPFGATNAPSTLNSNNASFANSFKPLDASSMTPNQHLDGVNSQQQQSTISYSKTFRVPYS